MADHDPELWHAIGRLAMVVENINNKPVNFGGFFSSPEPSADFKVNDSKTYGDVVTKLEKATKDKESFGVYLRTVNTNIIANAKLETNASAEKKKTLQQEKTNLEAAKTITQSHIDKLKLYIDKLKEMKQALITAFKTKTANDAAVTNCDTVKTALGGLEKDTDATDKSSKDALKTAQIDVK